MAVAFTLGAQTLRTAGGLATVAAAGGLSGCLDLNGDGWDDFVFTGGFYPNQGPHALSADQPGWLALISAEGVTIAPESQFPGSALGSVHAREMVTADFNGDGVPDLFIADHGYDAQPFPGHLNHLFLSTGSSSWRNATATLAFAPDFTHSAAAGDVDRDGDIDLFVGNTVLGQAYFLLNDGRGGFVQNRALLPAGPGFDALYFESCLLVDLDGDGKLELVLGSRSSDRERQVFWNDGTGFAAGTTTALPVPAELGSSYTVLDIQSTDVNFDGRPDLLMNYQTTNGGWCLSVLINEGDRRFTDQTTTYFVQPEFARGGLGSDTVQPSLEFLRPLDLNGDGRMDFFTTPVAVRPAQPNPDVPVFLIQREDGRFDVLTSGMLLAAGLEPDLFNGLEYAQRGAPGHGELLQHYQQGSTVHLNVQPLRFGPVASTWHAGTAGNDVFVGGGAADWFGGHGGVDRAVYAVPRTDVTLSRSTEGWQVDGSATGRDTLVDIERLQFSDVHLALDLDGHAGQVARVLGAVFGPTYVSNATYAGIGLALLDQGMSYADLVTLAWQTEVFTQLAGDRSHAGFVRHVYQNVFGTLPGEDETSHYVRLLDDGTYSPARLALLACDTSLLAVRIDLVGLSESGLIYLPSDG